MKITGYNKNIKAADKVFILGNISGVQGTIHLCENCITDISSSKNKGIEE